MATQNCLPIWSALGTPPTKLLANQKDIAWAGTGHGRSPPMTTLDRKMLDWFLSTARPVHILLGKSNKLNKDDANIALRHVAKTVAQSYLQCTVQMFSSVSKIGVDQASAVVATWFNESLKNKKPPVKGEQTGGETP